MAGTGGDWHWPQSGPQQQPRGCGAKRRRRNSDPPCHAAAEQADDPEGQARPHGKRRRVEGDVAWRGTSGQPVCKQFQSRHVGPGEAGAGDDLEQRGGPDTAGVEAISERSSAGHRARCQPHPTCVDAVGEAREHRDRQHVSAEVGAADPAGRRIAQCPLVPEQRLEREKHRERRHAQNFREADECDDAGRTRNFQPSNYISIGHAVEAPIRPHCRVPVQSRANRQLRGVTSTFRRAVNPVDVNVPSSRWVNVCPPESGPKTAVALKAPFG